MPARGPSLCWRPSARRSEERGSARKRRTTSSSRSLRWEKTVATWRRFSETTDKLLAQVLSSNTKALSRQQWREELSGRIAYYDDDLTIITWNAALVFGTNMEDVLTVLELANVQLRELHYLDDQLDDSLEESYDIRAQTKSVKTSMRRIRELMLDGQAFSEAVTNAFKPFPDAFLARVYALASQALGLNHSTGASRTS